MSFVLPSNRIILDCDDILLDYLPGFTRFARETLGISLRGERPAGFDFTEWLGLDHKDEMRAILKAFNEGESTGFEDLQPIDGAVQAIRALKEMGFHLAVVTSSSSQSDSRTRRIANLERYFGSGTFEDVTCLDMGVSKIDALRRHAPSLWIEDLPSNALLGLEAGHTSCILDAHHNGPQKDEFVRKHGIPWFENWDHLMRSIFHADLQPDIAETW